MVPNGRLVATGGLELVGSSFAMVVSWQWRAVDRQCMGMGAIVVVTMGSSRSTCFPS